MKSGIFLPSLKGFSWAVKITHGSSILTCDLTLQSGHPWVQVNVCARCLWGVLDVLHSREQKPWPLTTKIWSVQPLVEMNIYTEFEESPSRCFWAVVFTRPKMGVVRSQRPWPLTVNHQNPISSSLCPTESFYKIVRKSHKAFLTYRVQNNGTAWQTTWV